MTSRNACCETCALKRQSARLEEPACVPQQLGRGTTRDTEGLADAVRLEHATAVGDTVVQEHVHEGMPEPGAFRPLLVPDDLVGNLAGVHEAQSHRRTARDVNPRSAERDETIRHQLGHGLETTSVQVGRRRPKHLICWEICRKPARSAQKLNIQSTHKWCDFSQPASLTGGRSW